MSLLYCGWVFPTYQSFGRIWLSPDYPAVESRLHYFWIHHALLFLFPISHPRCKMLPFCFLQEILFKKIFCDFKNRLYWKDRDCQEKGHSFYWIKHLYTTDSLVCLCNCFAFWQYLGWNSGPCACWTVALPLESCPQAHYLPSLFVCYCFFPIGFPFPSPLLVVIIFAF
jgi:hypothetical protein